VWTLRHRRPPPPHCAAMGARRADGYQTRSASFPTRVKDVLARIVPADDAEPPDDPIATPREIGERPGIMTMDIRGGNITGWAAGCRLCGSDIVYPRDEEGNGLTKSGQEPEKNRRESTRTLKPERHNPFWCDVHGFCHSERLPDRHPTVRARAEPISSYNPDPTTRL
jgi:hypothetical protein